MEVETEERTKPIAILMAFGTKGDVYPIAVTLSFPFPFPLSNYDYKHSISLSLPHFHFLRVIVVSTFQAIAAAFACDQKQYSVLLITHSAHKVCARLLFNF